MPTQLNQQTLEEIQKRNAEEQAPVVTEQNTQTLNRSLTPKEETMNRKAQELHAPATENIPAETQPAKTYLGDYANDTDLMGIAKKKNIPLQNVFLDYQQWGKDTGNHTDFLPMWIVSQNTDITKTPAQIEKDKKKAERQEKWEKIGNFLSHLGNFIGAAGFGAPSQTLESPRELTARQQAIRDKTEALRNAYNNSFFENYWKKRNADRQAEIDKQKMEIENRRLTRQEQETKIRQEKNDAYVKYIDSQTSKNAEQSAYWKAKYEALESGKSLDEALKAARIAQARAAANLSNTRAAHVGDGTLRITTDQYGNTSQVEQRKINNSPGHQPGDRRPLPGTGGGRRKLPGAK